MSATRCAMVFLNLMFLSLGYLALGTVVLSTLQPVWAQSLGAAPASPDVRVLIDVSGSMKKNDPHNLRKPAIDLLVKLLPEDSAAGIWLFGDSAESLVSHERISDAWRVLAGEKATLIDSRAMFTDIGGALEAAVAAGAPAGGYQGSIILLTDGVVDISKDPEANRRELQRIVSDLLPRLQAAGLKVHTIALSENADQDLLQTLSLTTDGLAATARTADELMAAFLKIFDTAAPPERVSLEGNRFKVDASIQEFTALVFRKPGSEPARLQDPDGTTLSYGDRGSDVGWHRAEHYDLITVSQPLPGTWRVLADMEPDSRVTVVSNLRLRLGDMPTNVLQGQGISLSYALHENDRVVNRREFLSLMAFELELQHLAEGQPAETVWRSTVANDAPPASGIFSASLPKFSVNGEYRLRVRVDGKSFQRESSHVFSAHKPLLAEMTAEAGNREGEVQYRLRLRSTMTNIDASRTQVVATLISPEGRRTVKPVPATEQGDWQLAINPASTGRYRTVVTVSGTESGGADFQYQMADLEFYYSPERGMIQQTATGESVSVEPPQPVDDGVSPEPSAVSEIEPEIAVEAEPFTAAEPVDEPPVDQENPVENAAAAPAAAKASPQWALYSTLGLGNVFLFGLGYWAYRRFLSSKPDTDAILRAYADNQIAEPKGPGAPPAEPAGEGGLEEPPGEQPNTDDNDAESIFSVNDASSSAALDPADEASLDEALASILGEFEEPAGTETDDDAADGEDFGLSEGEKDDDKG